MAKKTRRQNGQSMVEYAIGIGCVAALCMVALGSLGHISGVMITKVCHAINAPHHSHGPKPGRTISTTATPWTLD